MKNLEYLADALDALKAISPVALVGVDEHGRIDLWNGNATRLFGWREDEVLGKPLPPQLAPLSHASPASEQMTPVSVLGRDGRQLIIESRLAARSLGGLVIVATDASRAETDEREKRELLEREREANLRFKAESRFRELLEAAPDAIIEVDREGRILLLNRVTEELFDYTREELLGSNVDRLLPVEMMGKHAEHRARYWASPSTRPMGRGYVLKARRRDGSEFPVEISLSPVRAEGGFRVTAIIRDVTAQKQIEEKIRLANQELELRHREAERANALKSEFLASMSHELRTPLHTILGFTELLEEEIEGPLNEKQKRFVRHVHQDSMHLLELINDILDLSKIEAGRMDLNLESLDVSQVAAETMAGIRQVAEAKNIRVDNEIDTPVYVLADRVRLREIMTNLLGNAVKFTPEGGRVWLQLARTPAGFAEIAVGDTGIGISHDDQQVIFDKFRQVASTTRGVREGTGLGLAIVKQLVEMHGGTISVESACGQGSVFTFTIPADPAHDRDQPVVLVIEDEPSARELLSSYLGPLGVKTVCAASADEGMALARECHPDVIMLDLLLPDRTGWRVLEDLRASTATQSIPVIVTSVLDYHRASGIRGAAGYLQKPLKKDAVVRALREYVPSRFATL